MTSNTLDPKLAAMLASTSSGFGAVIDGVLNVQTVPDSCNRAALNALFITGYRVLSNCQDPDCDCFVRTLSALRPDVKILPVTVSVTK